MVTDGKDDNHFKNLDVECASLVKSHNIHMAMDVDEAVDALQRVARGEALPTRAIGQVQYSM
jgi:hypothetical protein